MKRQRYPKSLKEQLVREVQEVGNAVSVQIIKLGHGKTVRSKGLFHSSSKLRSRK
jgi:transposase-like protein